MNFQFLVLLFLLHHRLLRRSCATRPCRSSSVMPRNQWIGLRQTKSGVNMSYYIYIQLYIYTLYDMYENRSYRIQSTLIYCIYIYTYSIYMHVYIYIHIYILYMYYHLLSMCKGFLIQSWVLLPVTSGSCFFRKPELVIKHDYSFPCSVF